MGTHLHDTVLGWADEMRKGEQTNDPSDLALLAPLRGEGLVVIHKSILYLLPGPEGRLVYNSEGRGGFERASLHRNLQYDRALCPLIPSPSPPQSPSAKLGIDRDRPGEGSQSIALRALREDSMLRTESLPAVIAMDRLSDLISNHTFLILF